MNIVFMGTPSIASIVLRAIEQYVTISSVYTRPDALSGRGKKEHYSPVKTHALERGYPLFQPKTLRTEDAIETLRILSPDLLIVVAYGAILPKAILDIPVLGAINVHGSLLPAYRGAAPIQRALWNGEPTTGVTIMKMDAGLDTGDMLLTSSFPIQQTDTTKSIMEKMGHTGARALLRTLSYYEAMKRIGTTDPEAILNVAMRSSLYSATSADTIEDYVVAPKKQDDAMASYAEKIRQEDEYIVWDNAQHVHWRIQSVTNADAPIATSTLYREGAKPLRVKFCLGMYTAMDTTCTDAGTVLGLFDGMLHVACAKGVYMFSHVRPESKKTITAHEFYAGYIQKKSAYFSGLLD